MLLATLPAYVASLVHTETGAILSVDGREVAQAPTATTTLDRIFWISLTLKGFDGVFELVGGALLLFVTPSQIGALARLLTQHELIEDPNDIIAKTVLHFTSTLYISTSLFGAAYLLLHGLVKVVLVWAVLREHFSAYPWMIAFLIVFIVYQSYQMIVSFSWALRLHRVAHLA